MNNQQLQQRQQNVANALQLESIQNQLTGLLANNPRKIEAFKTKMLKMSTDYMLQGCTPESLISCGIQALTLDLPLEAGQGYIVKYEKEAQLDIGYKGWQMLAKRSGYSVLADSVYTCDLFEPHGFGFNAKLNFEPNHNERKTADDKWVKENIRGVIVSIREDETGLDMTKWVPADLLFKIIGKSPSNKTEKGKKFSPHENWVEQMMCAKAIKQVISKIPIDLSKASMLNEAIGIVNSTESVAQQPEAGLPEYSQERFETNWPKWVELVENGKQKAVTIITQLSNGFALTESQMNKVMELQNSEPIEGQVVDTELKTFADDEFREEYNKWFHSVENGETAPNVLIESLKTTHQLTDSQLNDLNGLHDCVPVALKEA